MPIHVSWKSMAEGMRGTYKQGKVKCRPFTDGSQVCMRAKAWQVFFATINKMGADETKPRPARKKSVNEAKLIERFLESKGINEEVPRWAVLAKKVLGSDKFNEKIKGFWKKKLDDWCSKNPKSKFCKGD